ncbi:metallophosphoesterase [Cytobacillus depressus]|uniref:Phosphoesterase n=1 Tax=Cytobacillus depressus TaxID=1602942 RepID=A0A6L3VI66_9BACI|nr:metallophosphoesterase [Cytobacillus depressus]KAB2338755.1 metallophosphoesterase [Cytobacillus depressus]
MKVLIVSDSHGLTNELTEIKNKHAVEAGMLIHCGDSELAADHPCLEGFSTVRGNCDFDMDFSEELLEDANGYKVFITHGHRYSVKSTLMNLSYRAKELGAKIVCFGHSHSLGAEVIDGILFINPGSIRLPRGRKEKTYVVLDIEKNNIKLRVYDLKLGEISHLAQEFLLP